MNPVAVVLAAEIPLLAEMDHGGRWRRVVGLEIDSARVVSVRLEDWAGVVNYSADWAVPVRLPR